MIVLIDNYDSFTYNIVHCLEKLSCDVRVDEAKAIGDLSLASHIIISPGAGKPNEAIESLEIIRKYKRVKPILGICLGHQCIAHIFGGRVEKGREPIHGKTSKVRFIPNELFVGCNQGFEVMRYHSLSVNFLGNELDAIAWSDEDKTIMAIKHKRYPIYGVQFHPESILSECGERILGNFIKITFDKSQDIWL